MKRIFPKPKNNIESAIVWIARLSVAAAVLAGILVCSVFFYVYIAK